MSKAHRPLASGRLSLARSSVGSPAPSLGTALSPHTRGFLVGLYHLVNRRLASSEHDQLRFELLLQ